VANDVGEGSLPRRCALFGVRALSRGSLLLDDDLTALRRLIVCAGARRVRAIVDGTRDARARLNRGDLLGSRSSTRRSRTGSSHTRRRTWCHARHEASLRARPCRGTSRRGCRRAARSTRRRHQRAATGRRATAAQSICCHSSAAAGYALAENAEYRQHGDATRQRR